MTNGMKEINEQTFARYGQELKGFDFVDFVDTHHEELIEKIPRTGNHYEASTANLESTSLYDWLKENVYGNMEIQLGICAGQNTETTAVEYHMGSEVVIALTDCLLPLGAQADMIEAHYDVAKMETFLLKKGQAVELYSTTLHYSPLKKDDQGYATLVALLRGTNDLLTQASQNPLLLVKNKFMIVHASREDKIAAGALPNLKNQRI